MACSSAACSHMESGPPALSPPAPSLDTSTAIHLPLPLSSNYTLPLAHTTSHVIIHEMSCFTALAAAALLALLASLTTHVHAMTPSSVHAAPSLYQSFAPLPNNSLTHPLLAAINYRTASHPADIQPGQLNYYNFTRPEGTREFYLYVPTTYNNKSAYPFTFYFHGYTADYRQGIMLNMTTDAEAAGYLIAFTQGTPTTTGPTVLGWNGGECCLFNDSSTVDDVEYTRVALSMIQSAANIESSRTYAMGWSNGGFMVERLLCETGSLFAGIAADASAVGILPGGQKGLAYCDAVFGANYTNYFHIHGTADTAVPWVGWADNSTGFLHGVPSALDDLARWVQRLDCSSYFRQTYNDGTFSNLIWPHCRHGREVEFMTVRDGIHAWWTQNQGDFETTKYVLDFFDRTHRKQHSTATVSEA